MDRLTSWVHQAIQTLSQIPFNQADGLWTSFQNMINTFVNQNGGNASVGAPDIHRPDWQTVKDVIEGRAPLSTLSKDCPE